MARGILADRIEKDAIQTSGGRGVGVGGAILDPRMFPDLAFWWDASKMPAQADSSVVTDWFENLRGLAKFTQATAGNKPLYRMNLFGSLPGIQFDGVDDFMSCVIGTDDNSVRPVPYVFLLVARLNNLANARYLYGEAADHNLVLVSGSAIQWNVSNWSITGTVPPLTALAVGDAFVLTGSVSDAVNASWFRINGNQFDGGGSVANGLAVTNHVLGARNVTPTTPAQVDIAEIMVFASKTSATGKIAMPTPAQLLYLEKSLQYKYWPAFRVRG